MEQSYKDCFSCVYIFIGYANFEKEKKDFQDNLVKVEKDKQHHCYTNSYKVVYAIRVFNTCFLMGIDSFIYMYFNNNNTIDYINNNNKE